MSISRSTFLVGVLVASAVTSAAAADDLASAVAARLRESGAVTGHKVDIKAKAGTVILEGQVGDASQLAAAEEAAAGTEGVERVVNRLSIARKAAAEEEGRSGGLLNAFSIPSSIRSAVGLGKGSKATTPRDVQLTQAVGAAPEGADPRPLGRAPARPLQPHAAGRGPLGGQTVALRQPMNLPSPGGAYGGVVNDTIVGGMAGGVPAGVGGGQIVPGSVRYSENGAPMQGVPMQGAPMAGGPGMGGPMMAGPGGGLGAPMPARGMGVGAGAVPMRGDGPNMPNYAWPSYASSPNYAAVQYPTQYSPTAWPYIGPFYPYPQVPLGWRRVSLEWDDGWWWLDFDERHIHSHHR